ncbi:GspH/FimT family pseudopilin [Marinobacter adhaerens]|jgi:type IV fimbrial biogenesis protein FimT|uniref:GspH/FimT family pseudopilin n=1 Tax=Marinobacter adhaerens TaxID=1033846 RepID=UPI003BAAB1E1
MDSSLKKQGFTLVEAVVTVALIAITASVASISWSGVVSASRHNDLVNGTHRLFATARSFAVHQGTLTTVCPLSAQLQCVDDWNQPVSVFPDMNNDKRPDSNKVHKVLELTKTGSHLFSRTAGRGYFQFSSDGMSHGTMGSLIACSRLNTAEFEMTYMAINIGGRLRSLRDKNRDGKITLPWGTIIKCPG